MDRPSRPADRRQRILDLIDACLAEHGTPRPPRRPDPAVAPRRP